MDEPQLTNKQRVQALADFEEWAQDTAPAAARHTAVESYLATLHAAESLEVVQLLIEAGIDKHVAPSLVDRLRAIAGDTTA